MRRPLVLLPALAAAAALAAGCGSSGNGSSSSATATASSKPASSGGGAVVVTMKDIQFHPTTVTVKTGQTVEWRNDDSVSHNVTAQSGASFKSKDFGNGGTFKFKATKAGTIKYVCTIHPGMDGTLTVQ
jgi:plastocyanin